MKGPDLLVLLVYFAALAGIGWKTSSHSQSDRDLLQGDRQIPWWAVLLSVLGSEISALTFVGVPAFAYTGNWTYLQVTLGAIGGRYLVGRYFVPAFYRHNVSLSTNSCSIATAPGRATQRSWCSSSRACS